MPPPSRRLSWLLPATRQRPCPLAWYHVILWEARRDAFTPEAWFRGRIDEERCDLSLGGTLFVDFAFKGIRLGATAVRSWTAVRLAPWLRPPVIWPQGITYGSSGRFTGPRRLAPSGVLGLDKPHPVPPAGLELDLNGPAHEPRRSAGLSAAPTGRASTTADGSSLCDGRLFRRVRKDDVPLADLNGLRPDPRPPPEWARRPL